MGIFKAYDIRGLYPGELNEELARKIGYCAAQVVGVGTYAVGRDGRRSGPALSEAFSDGLLRAGCHVVDLGMVATPMLTFAVAHYGYDGGVMVTASHNPKDYNGFKLVRKEGKPVSGDTGIADIESRVVRLGVLPPRPGGARKVQRNCLDDYVGHLMSFVRGIGGLAVVVDASHGMAGVYLPKLFERLEEVSLVPLYFEPDGDFPDHGPNPMEAENLRDIREAVRREGADLGVIFDGDADRVVFIDEQGEPVPCDLVIALLARQALAEHPGAAVVYDVRSSWAVREEVAALGGKPVMGRVGHSFMKALLREVDGVLAGELSGHYYFRENHYADDGAIAAIEVMNLLSRERKSMSALLKPLRRYFGSGEINSDVADKDGKIAEVRKRFAHGGRVIELDGLTVEFDDWWFNLRPSNTEPKLRLSVEAKTRELLERRRDELLQVIRG